MRVKILMLCVACGCAKPTPKLNETSSPPSPKTVSEEERGQIRAYMWALAGEVRALDEELSFEEATDADRYVVESKLKRILDITDDLALDNQTIQHPLVGQGLGHFKAQVSFAIASIENQELSYVSAGKVIGACATCHDVRACPFDSYSRCVDFKAPPSL
ncbi:MAG: hypothetical protein AAF658_00140 [Myxococcota bacterium]